MKRIFLIAALILLPAQARAEGMTYKGYACTDDCSGHKAGYEWAKKNGLTDPAECGGKSKSFVEGCRSFTVEFEDAPPEEPQNSEQAEE